MKVITITGPSGSGKDSITDAMLYCLGEKPAEELTPFVRSKIPELDSILLPPRMFNKPYMRELISHTTRAPRAGEVNGKDYYFITKEEFDRIPKVESTCYSGNYYCLSAEAVEKNPAKVGIVIVDIEGKEAVENFVGKENLASIFLEVSPDVIGARMRARGDSEENIQKRLTNAEETGEFLNGPKCKYVIKNDDFIEAVKEAFRILETL